MLHSHIAITVVTKKSYKNVSKKEEEKRIQESPPYPIQAKAKTNETGSRPEER